MSLRNLARQSNEQLTSIIRSHGTDGFFLTFEPASLQAKWYSAGCQPTRNPRLLVLDSSFNPPTKAHAALLTKALDSRPGYYDASLLLLSTQNADKKLTGASIVERAQMMEIMARRQESHGIPVYVGLTCQARFINKASELQNWHQKQQEHQKFQYTGIELHFILGHDTVTRLLDPKYYAPQSVKEALNPFFKNCYLICADRPGYTKENDDDELWSTPMIRSYADRISRISLVDYGSVASISSTLARKTVARISVGDGKRETLLQILDDDIADYVLDAKLYQ
jgi:nicotinamide-nucleotide adenylyltransferase